MSGLYCPDCGAQCQANDAICPDCKFPLELELLSQKGGLFIGGSQLDVWKRIAQLLKRSGIRVSTQTHGSNAWIWWLLPGSGLCLFLLTVMFGHKVVDVLWQPPVAAMAALDLNKPKPEVEEVPAESHESIELIAEAFKPSAEQVEELVTEEDLASYQDRATADIETIRSRFKEVYLSVQVKGKVWHGTRITNKGHILVDSRLLEGAFVREVKNDRVTVVVPLATSPGQSEVETEFVEKSDLTGVSLLKSSLAEPISFKIDYNSGLMLGSYVWVAKYTDERFYPEEIRLSDNIKLNDEIVLYVLEQDLGASYSGSPVLNEYGDLAGVLIHILGKSAVLPTVTIRERAPLIYKVIH